VKVNLTPLQSRALAILLLLLLFACCAALALLSVQKLNAHYDVFIEDRLDKASRFLRIAATRPEVEAQLAEVRALDGKRYYLKNSSPALAAAEIQNKTQELIESTGLRLESTQIAPHVDKSFSRKISINLKMRGKLPDLQKFLYAQAVESPYLYVDNLSIHSSVTTTFTPVPGMEPDVLASFDLYGYAHIQAAAEKPARSQNTIRSK